MGHFGISIKNLRIKKGLTLKKVADYLGVHLSYIGNIESGIKAASPLHIKKLSKILGVSTEFLETELLAEKVILQVQDSPVAYDAIKLAHKWLKQDKKTH